ncbi:DUF4917 family protein (plasmid) [Chromobacterium amazonense]|uniref:DUF4917 family protein n=1 Tax=Chromobacterium amazonense TaxID=1382803 RepID=UPI00237DCD54|nr:DUF4917 family protein [Chromobacterium amazonense]MDE1713584.1 DUF4917 family protein [Chromobacterium amazonense]
MHIPQRWESISNLSWKNLLFGNGLGRTYCDKFAYQSLLESFECSPVGTYICTKDIFDRLNTVNFEEVLRAIFHAYQVSIDNQDALKTLYVDVKKALICAVNTVHPKYDEVPNEKIGECLGSYGAIFTTNYDLLPYWAVLSGKTDKFVDYFWGRGVFDPSNVEVYPNKIPIHYLHGALHLQSEGISDAMKLSIKINSGADGAISADFIDRFPLFITEGKSALKLNRIRGNSYLNFCYEQLSRSSGGLVIYGHDLNPEYDGHIIDAIKKSNNKEVAVSVFFGLDGDKKEKFMYDVQGQFLGAGKEIYFYESHTHPLAQCRA